MDSSRLRATDPRHSSTRFPLICFLRQLFSTLIVKSAFMCLSLASCRPNSFDHRGKPGSIFKRPRFRTSASSVGVGCGWGTSVDYHPSRACLGMHPLPHIHRRSCWALHPHSCSGRLLLLFLSSASPLCSPDERFQILHNRVLNASPNRFASVRLALLMRGGSGEASQLRYIDFLRRAGVTTGPGTNVWKADNASKPTILNCSGPLVGVSWIPLGVGWAPSSQYLLVHHGSWKE